MIRALDRFHAKHPRLALSLAILVAFICLYIANEIDNENTAALRLQMATTSKGTT